LRVVLDTNVVLSALLWQGTPYRLLQSIRQNEAIKLFSSDILLAELADVLNRPNPARRLALLNIKADQMLADYVAAINIVVPLTTPRTVPDDPDDDHVIAAAIAARADIIASGDKHLLKLGVHENIRIVAPTDLLTSFLYVPK
jgi:putative PIN family toxin of toxin-antitoxin system